MQGTGLLGVPAEPLSWVRINLAASRLEGPAGAEEESGCHYHARRLDPVLKIGQKPRRKDSKVRVDRQRVGLGAKEKKSTGDSVGPTYHCISIQSHHQHGHAYNFVVGVYRKHQVPAALTLTRPGQRAIRLLAHEGSACKETPILPSEWILFLRPGLKLVTRMYFSRGASGDENGEAPGYQNHQGRW